MFEKVLYFFTCIVAIFSCNSDEHEIKAICQRDDIGNYLIKWETSPSLTGMVKIQVSENPESFKEAPIIYTDIKEGVATYITNDNFTRKYFQLTFNDQYTCIVGARAGVLDKVQNLRDLGGYKTKNGKTVKWGKIFRSGTLSELGEGDSIRLQKLGIKTIVDLRTEHETRTSPIRYKGPNIIHIPISIGKIKDALSKITEGEIRKGDAQIYMEDEYIQFVTDNTEQFSKALNVLQKEENYPIIICCSFGKDRTGFISAILLSALGVNDDIIMEDYLASNKHIKLTHLADMVSKYSTDIQECITVFLISDEDFMNLALKQIKKEYGSFEKYLSEGLHLSKNKLNKIKDILLY